MDIVSKFKLRKLTAFLIYSITTAGIVWFVKEYKDSWTVIAAILGSYTSGFTALMWGNSNEHKHESKGSGVQPEVKP